MSLEEFNIPYGYYIGGYSQGDGVLPAEMMLYEYGTFSLKSVESVDSLMASDNIDDSYDYTYLGTYYIDHVDEDNNVVLSLNCADTVFKLTWKDEEFRNESFFLFFDE